MRLLTVETAALLDAAPRLSAFFRHSFWALFGLEVARVKRDPSRVGR